MKHKSQLAYERVREEIYRSAQRAGRQPSSITLIAVSKTFSAPEISPIIDLGQVNFGENRVQETQRKWPELLEKPPDIRLHLIGPLQSNKVDDAFDLYSAIHTLDRLRLAECLSKTVEKRKSQPTLFVQVNTGCEPQKSGIKPIETEKFIKTCRDDYGLVVSGLMCIPPVLEDPARHFALLARLAEENKLPFLSMGMSHDFQIAIEYGASHIRVGSAIFGSR